MLKDKLEKIIENSGERRYARSIKENNSLHDELIESTKHLDSTATIPERVYVVINSIDAKCQNGNYPVFKNIKEGYRKYCGSGKTCKCRLDNQSKILIEQQSNLSDEEKQRRRSKYESTMTNTYGVSNPMFVQSIRDKQEATNLERYGAKSPFESHIIQEKISDTNLERHGVERPFQNIDILKKAHAVNRANNGDCFAVARKVFLDRNNGLNPFQTRDIKDKISDHWKSLDRAHNKQIHISDESYKILSNKELFYDFIKGKNIFEIKIQLAVWEGTIYSRLTEYGLWDEIGSVSRSSLETNMINRLREYNINFVSGNRSLIKPYEIDLYFPDIKSGIELNGLYWHSEKFKDKNYHMTKYRIARDNGIHLFQFYEDELRDKEEIILNKILYLHNKIECKKIGARQIVIKPIESYEEESKFLNMFHIQGSSSSRTKTFGGYYKDVLVCLMSINISDGVMDITRYATNTNYVISGGFSKLEKYAIQYFNFKGTIISFSDNNHSDGGLYRNNGYMMDSKVSPSYYITDFYNRFRRERFRKERIKEKFPDIYSDDKTEHQMTLELGLMRIYDSGKIKWKKEIK